MRLKVTRRDPLALIPQPQVAGSIPAEGAGKQPGPPLLANPVVPGPSEICRRAGRARLRFHSDVHPMDVRPTAPTQRSLGRYWHAAPMGQSTLAADPAMRGGAAELRQLHALLIRMCDPSHGRVSFALSVLAR